MAYGKQAARVIDQQLMEEDRWEQLFPAIPYDQTVPKEVSHSSRSLPPHLPVKKRANSFEEVVAVLTSQETMDEVSRCLRCDVKAAPSR